MLSFAEGDRVYYASPTSALPSGFATVLDVWVEGERAEPEYVIDLGFGPVRAAQSELTVALTTSDFL